MEFELIKEPVERTRAQREDRSPLVLNIEEWLCTDNSTLKIKCASREEARRIVGSCYQYRRLHNLDYTIFQKLVEVYLIKA